MINLQPKSLRANARRLFVFTVTLHSKAKKMWRIHQEQAQIHIAGSSPVREAEVYIKQ